MCLLGVYFQLITGCRPSEAAYLILTKNSFQQNDFPAFKGCTWKATIPKEYTKTKVEYKWGIPPRANFFVKVLKQLHRAVPNLKEVLRD